MSTESIESATKFITLATAFTGFLSLILKSIIDNIKGKYDEKDETNKIELIEKIIYDNNEAKNNLKKSLAFRSLTGKIESIRKIKLIMECPDPAMALHIYSQAPNYIKIKRSNSGDELDFPDSIKDSWQDLFLKFLSLAGYIGFLANYLFISVIISNASKSTITNSNLLSSILILSGFFAFTSCSFWYFIVSANKELKLLNKTRDFYGIEARENSIQSIVKNIDHFTPGFNSQRKRRKTHLNR